MKNPPNKITRLTRNHKLALFLVSMSVLLLEFTLIRILSVTLWYHFAFMIISIALLGFGISGVTIVLSDRISKADTNNFLCVTSLSFSVSILLSFFLLNKIPFDPFSLLVDSSQFIYLPLYYILVTLPFFLAGLVIGLIFTRFKNDIGKLYFFDLIGAGLSCFVFILAMPMFGGSGSIVVASIVACIGAALFALEASKPKTVSLFALFILIIMNGFLLTDPEHFLPLNVSENKVYSNLLKENPHLKILTRWNSFSRVDVMKDEDPPVDAYPVHTAIIDMGNSTTNIPQVPINKDTLPKPLDASNLAMVLKHDSASVFIVGSGGGGEIVSALSHNAKNVTAVEINGILNDLIEKDFAPYWTAGIAKNKKVNLITDDARSYLRSKRIKWDVIISAHTISASASSSGAMSLVENYILTQEAVMEYLQHLKVDGVLYVTRPESQIPRLVSTIKIAHQKIGGIDFKNQFFIFKRPPNEFEVDMSYLTGVVYKKDGFDEIDIQYMKLQSALLGLEVVYDPVSRQDGIYKELIESDNIYETIKKFPMKLLPATDDNPYFEHFTDFTELSGTKIKEAFSQTDRAMISLVQKPVAEATLLVLLAQTIIFASLFILLPIWLKFRKQQTEQTQSKGKFILYFACLGLGYIMIEICLIQKFTLFLGQPVYTMLTVISTMLIFSGIGSMLSQKILSLLKGKVLPVFIIIFAYTILLGFLNSLIFDSLVRADILWRVVISIALIAPLATLMGVPFPYGFMQIATDNKMLAAYSWGINGFFSVIGSVLVIMLSMSYGFKVVFIISAVMYLIAMGVSGKLKVKS